MNSTPSAPIENICRTCMGEDENFIKKSSKRRKTVSIFNVPKSMENGNITIMELLMLTTAQLNIEKDDMLPKILCESCLDRLINAHEFQQMCIRVQQRFREILNEQKPVTNQNNNDPLNDSVTPQTINDLSNIIKIEMDEPLIDHDVSSANDADIVDDGINSDHAGDVKFEIENNDWVDSSDEVDDDPSDKESEWEFPLNNTTSKKRCTKLKLKKLKEETVESSKSERNSKESPDKSEDNRNEADCEPNLTQANIQDDVDKKHFVCDECGNRLKTRKSLKRHKRIHLRPPGGQRGDNHNTKTKYECEFCQKVFQQSSSLKDHLRIHTGEQPYLCSECGKAFKSLSNMKQHFLRHGTDRPYECPDCPKRFPCLSDLASHKAVHSKTKSHVCDVCGAGFVKPYLLKKHKMYHTGEKNHKCDYCDMRFVLADQCRRHMRTHTGEKPYKCKYCERAFAQSNDLIKHLRGHLGDNVYKCDLCPQGFRLQGDLRAHFNTHKNDDEETKLKNLQALKDEEQRLQIKFGMNEVHALNVGWLAIHKQMFIISKNKIKENSVKNKFLHQKNCEMNNTTNPQIENLCRTCMGEEQDGKTRKNVSIFYAAESLKNNMTIMDLLLITTPQLNIEKNDMLPKVLCENCIENLVKAHDFQQMCIRVEKRLKDIINELTPIPIQYSSDPLKDSLMPNTLNDLNSILKIEIDEPLIDHNGSIAGDDDDDIFNEFQSIPTTSDDDSDIDSEWESNNIKLKKIIKGISNNKESSQKEHLDDTSKEFNSSSSKLSCQSYECNECGNRLKTRKSLKRHQLIHIRLQEQKDEPKQVDNNPTEPSNQSNLNSSVSNAQNDDEKSSYQFECDECNSRLKTRKSLKRHKKIHLRPPGVKKEKQIKITTQTIYECEHCKKVFQKSSALKDHIRLHTGEQPYLCSECGKSFRKSSNLKQHLLRHGTERPYVCPDCPKNFPTLSDLASHKAVHTKTKSHVCDVCGAAFVKPYLLKAHNMYHTGEKNHKCEYCDRRFVTGDQCRRHMRTHTGEKPYKCKYCERAFAQSNDLMKHLRSHLGDNVYKCSMCPQGFRLHGDLREHFNTHKNDDEDTKVKNLQALKEDELRLQIKFGLIGDTQ